MIYNVIGLMSGSSLDGLDIAFVEFSETAGNWDYRIKCAACVSYHEEWLERLQNSVGLSAFDYQILHTDYGRFLGESVNDFIEQFGLDHKVDLIASHGHTTFHFPKKKITHQLGDGASIAATTQLPVVSDLRSMDVAFGGQGAPIVPMGEKLLFPDIPYFLNIGGIANVSIGSKAINSSDFYPHKKEMVAFDICAANRVLNMFAAEKDLNYDEDEK